MRTLAAGINTLAMLFMHAGNKRTFQDQRVHSGEFQLGAQVRHATSLHATLICCPCRQGELSLNNIGAESVHFHYRQLLSTNNASAYVRREPLNLPLTYLLFRNDFNSNLPLHSAKSWFKASGGYLSSRSSTLTCSEYSNFSFQHWDRVMFWQAVHSLLGWLPRHLKHMC